MIRTSSMNPKRFCNLSFHPISAEFLSRHNRYKCRFLYRRFYFLCCVFKNIFLNSFLIYAKFINTPGQQKSSLTHLWIKKLLPILSGSCFSSLQTIDKYFLSIIMEGIDHKKVIAFHHIEKIARTLMVGKQKSFCLFSPQ